MQILQEEFDMLYQIPLSVLSMTPWDQQLFSPILIS